MEMLQLSLATHRELMEEVVRAHLSTILFHRLFGNITPSSAEAVGITYPVSNNPESELALKEKMREMRTELNDTDVLTLSLKFYDRKVRKSSWFARTQDVAWEEWTLRCQVLPQTREVQESTQQQVQQNLLDIISAMDSRKEHIPPITTTDSVPFPYEITFSRPSERTKQ